MNRPVPSRPGRSSRTALVGSGSSANAAVIASVRAAVAPSCSSSALSSSAPAFGSATAPTTRRGSPSPVGAGPVRCDRPCSRSHCLIVLPGTSAPSVSRTSSTSRSERSSGDAASAPRTHACTSGVIFDARFTNRRSISPSTPSRWYRRNRRTACTAFFSGISLPSTCFAASPASISTSAWSNSAASALAACSRASHTSSGSWSRMLRRRGSSSCMVVRSPVALGPATEKNPAILPQIPKSIDQRQLRSNVNFQAAEDPVEARQRVLDEAFEANPHRFPRRPKVPRLHRAVYINPPSKASPDTDP